MISARRCASYFFVLIGLLVLALALQLLLAGTGQQQAVGCKAICGLTLLASLLGGEQFGAVVGSALWTIVGLVCLWLAWKLR